MNQTELEQRFSQLSGLLRSELNENGFWTGELSSSALATAVSIVALQLGDPDRSRDRIAHGIAWLIDNINEDGGFGDSPGSVSNVSTVLLCYAALRFGAAGNMGSTILPRMEQYLLGKGVDINSTGVVDSILSHYGKDYTFSVPILSMLVICRVLEGKALDQIPKLPFELTLLPAAWYRFFNMQVVSYAIPALVAVGIYLFRHKRPVNPVIALVRSRAVEPAMKKLLLMMPQSGGFLEAIPLTAFVSMCLIKSGFGRHPVVEGGLAFLKKLQRPDGSWPIDTDLSTWVTTLGIKALGNRVDRILPDKERERLYDHLRNNQYTQPHKFNHARPGGWGWSSFPGSVPDADDTAGAVLALLELEHKDNGEKSSPAKDGLNAKRAIMRGCFWLGGLQNRDGGIPTFCRGWGRLPFDQSCADLTGHALLAWSKTINRYSDPECAAIFQPQERQSLAKELKKLKKFINRALLFLEHKQRPDGSWLPLWFGNQHTGDQTNPVYGTARVMVYLLDAFGCSGLEAGIQHRISQLLTDGRRYLSDQQNDDGSWGAGFGIRGSIEETSLAISALMTVEPGRCMKGFDWLEQEFQSHGLSPKPIGLYFASLWYHEKLYPLVFYLDAVRRAVK